MKTVILPRKDCLRQAAEEILALLRRQPEANLALSAHDDCLALYAALLEAAGEKTVFARARFFAVSAFDGLPPEAPVSCRSRLYEALLRVADPALERSFFPDAQHPDSYDGLIAEAGGLDLAILGVGERGRIGFNEPATPFDSRCHRQKLTKATRRELAPLFGGEEQVPAYGVTLGIRSLTEAPRILVIALGERRADPVFRMLYARNDSFVPAAFLQLPPNVAVYLDEEASSRL